MQRLSQSELCVAVKEGRFDEVSRLLPKTIKDAVEQPPLTDMIKVVGKTNVILSVQYELVKMANLVSVGNNLNNAQIEFIATQLVEMFPAESLADFKLCFERGCIGQYGEIYRMDGIVLRKWMEQYLDEKYQHVEAEMMKQPDNIYKREEGEGYKEFLEWSKKLQAEKNIRPISTEDILREGQSDPAKKKGISYPVTPLEDLRKRELHLQYIKENYDTTTMDVKKLDTWVDEQTWLKNKGL